MKCPPSFPDSESLDVDDPEDVADDDGEDGWKDAIGSLRLQIGLPKGTLRVTWGYDTKFANLTNHNK